MDIEKELVRLQKELETAHGELKRVEAKLENENVVSRAPEAVVEMENAKRDKYISQIEKLRDSITSLK